MAKTLQSAVETLERDKAQLQGRVHSLEQRLMGTQASEGEDIEAPPSGEAAAIRPIKQPDWASSPFVNLSSDLRLQATALWSS